MQVKGNRIYIQDQVRLILSWHSSLKIDYNKKTEAYNSIVSCHTSVLLPESLLESQVAPLVARLWQALSRIPSAESTFA